MCGQHLGLGEILSGNCCLTELNPHIDGHPRSAWRLQLCPSTIQLVINRRDNLHSLHAWEVFLNFREKWHWNSPWWAKCIWLSIWFQSYDIVWSLKLAKPSKQLREFCHIIPTPQSQLSSHLPQVWGTQLLDDPAMHIVLHSQQILLVHSFCIHALHMLWNNPWHWV